VRTRELLLAGAVPLLTLTAVAARGQEPARPRVGLALGGGSAKGIAHVGVLQWLEEHHVAKARVVKYGEIR